MRKPLGPALARTQGRQGSAQTGTNSIRIRLRRQLNVRQGLLDQIGGLKLLSSETRILLGDFRRFNCGQLTVSGTGVGHTCLSRSHSRQPTSRGKMISHIGASRLDNCQLNSRETIFRQFLVRAVNSFHLPSHATEIGHSRQRKSESRDSCACGSNAPSLSGTAFSEEIERQILLGLGFPVSFGAGKQTSGATGARRRSSSFWGARVTARNGICKSEFASRRNGPWRRELSLFVNRIRPRPVHPQNHGPREQRSGRFVQVLLNQILNLFFQIGRVIQATQLKTFKRRNRCFQKKLIGQIFAAGHEALLGFSKLLKNAVAIYQTVIHRVNIPCENNSISLSIAGVYGQAC